MCLFVVFFPSLISLPCCVVVVRNTPGNTSTAVKRIQLLMANLPDSKRPKTALELKQFVQQYSYLINNGLGNFPPNSLASHSTSAASGVVSNSSLEQRKMLPATPVSTGLATAAGQKASVQSIKNSVKGGKSQAFTKP